MCDDLTLSAELKTALSMAAPPTLDLATVHARAATLRVPNRRRFIFAVIVLALIPAAAVAYANRDSVRHALLAIIPSANGSITVRGSGGTIPIISTHSVSLTMGNVRHLFDYEARMGVSPIALRGLPQQARIHSIIFIRKPGYALILRYELSEKHSLSIALGPENSSMMRAMHVAALHAPATYRTWLFKDARFIAISNTLNAAQLARIETATRAGYRIPYQ